MLKKESRSKNRLGVPDLSKVVKCKPTFVGKTLLGCRGFNQYDLVVLIYENIDIRRKYDKVENNTIGEKIPSIGLFSHFLER